MLFPLKLNIEMHVLILPVVSFSDNAIPYVDSCTDLIALHAARESRCDGMYAEGLGATCSVVMQGGALRDQAAVVLWDQVLSENY